MHGRGVREDELGRYGTPSFYSALSGVGILPTRNWRRGSYQESIGELDHEPYHEKLNVKKYACSGCPIGCGRLTEAKDPAGYPSVEGGGPEYEAVAAFGSKLLNSDISVVAAANHLANDLGLDVISAGQVIATAMEWYETGVLDEERTGRPASCAWGDPEAILTLVGLIGRREGIGDLLAEGVQRAAEALGPEAAEAAMHVKGVEMAADGVHASHSMTIVHACSARGADHLRPYTSAIDALGWRSEELGIEGDIDPLADGDKAWVKPFQELCMATNLMGVCLFTVITLAVRPSTWAGLLTAATGEAWTKERLLEAAERTIDLERVINARFGLDRKDDTLPERFTAGDGRGRPGARHGDRSRRRAGQLLRGDGLGAGRRSADRADAGAPAAGLDAGRRRAPETQRRGAGAAGRRGAPASASVPPRPGRGHCAAWRSLRPAATVVESPGAGGVRAAMRLALRASALMASAPGAEASLRSGTRTTTERRDEWPHDCCCW